ncbi:MAG: hypothetical protein K0S39_3088 [Paenibacillus sp.]|jgi:hypothetical protein|nr:hypothetical protein [Paenibacillus sp.]
MDQQTANRIDQLYEQVEKAHKELCAIWRQDILFTWQWWLLFVLFISAWTLWITCRKKQSTSRLLFAGFTVLILSSWFDFVGTALGFWSYRIVLVPTIPSFFILDFTLLPISVMLLLQYKPDANPYVKAAVFGLLTALIGEPAVIWLGTYHPIHWHLWCSIPIYTVIYWIAYKMSRSGRFESL